LSQAAFPGVVATEGERLRSMPADLVEGQRTVDVLTPRFQIAVVYKRRPQRMSRLHLVIGVAVRLGLPQERVARRDS
jgi:hypothetical protein